MAQPCEHIFARGRWGLRLTYSNMWAWNHSNTYSTDEWRFTQPDFHHYVKSSKSNGYKVFNNTVEAELSYNIDSLRTFSVYYWSALKVNPHSSGTAQGFVANAEGIPLYTYQQEQKYWPTKDNEYSVQALYERLFGANAERGSFFVEYKFDTRPTIGNNYERYSSLDYDNQDYVRWLNNNTSYAEEPEVWHTLNVSLRLKRGGHQIQLGESTRYRDEEQNVHDEQTYDYAESPYVEVRESNYKHKQLTNFLTARYSYTKSKFQAGVGCTYTFFYDQSETLQLQNKFSFTENLLSPYASLSYTLTPKWQLYLSYGMGCQVPSSDALNPYVSTVVPEQVSYGNPHLRPQTGHVLGLSSNIRVGKVNIYASTGYERYRDLILQHSFLDQAGMLHVTYDNIGRRQEWKNYVNASSKLTGTIYARLDAGLYYTRYPSNTIYAANAGWAFSTSGSVSQELPANFNISGGDGFNTAWIYMQGRGGKNYYYNLRVDKSFPMRRITLSAEARSFIPLHYDSRYENQSAGYFCTTRNRGYHASFVLSFRWNFGKLKAEERVREEGLEYNDVKRNYDE